MQNAQGSRRKAAGIVALLMLMSAPTVYGQSRSDLFDSFDQPAPEQGPASNPADPDNVPTMQELIDSSFEEYEQSRRTGSFPERNTAEPQTRQTSYVSSLFQGGEDTEFDSRPMVVRRRFPTESLLVENWRDTPDLVGDLFRSGGPMTITFRPVATVPPNAKNAMGPVVIDAANNRLVYLDGTDTLLVPGNGGLTDPFLLFRAPGGGLLTETTNAQGLTGFFGVERNAIDTGAMTTTTDSPFDVLREPGTETVTDPVSMAMGTSPPYTARFSLATQVASDPSLGPVGITRIAAGGSPIPRDRFFFFHSFFDNVPLANNGISVNRYTPGMELLLNDLGNASVEFRFPFAATLDPDFNINGGANTNEVAFGDVAIALKQVLHRDEFWLISTGLQFTIPTASDFNFQVTDFGVTRTFLSIENESVHIMPFLASVYAPNDRFFMQSFLQIDMDANGKPVLVNGNALNGGSLTQVGRLNSAPYLYADLNMGYWVTKEPDTSLRAMTGFAPMFELHYLRNIRDADSISFLPLGSIGSGDDVEVMTATVAGVFEFYHNTNLTVGYSVPVVGGSDEPFDGELRVMLSRRFGAGSN